MGGAYVREEKMQDPEISSNAYELNKLSKEQEELNEKLMAAMEEWEKESED